HLPCARFFVCRTPYYLCLRDTSHSRLLRVSSCTLKPTSGLQLLPPLLPVRFASTGRSYQLALPFLSELTNLGMSCSRFLLSRNTLINALPTTPPAPYAHAWLNDPLFAMPNPIIKGFVRFMSFSRLK